MCPLLHRHLFSRLVGWLHKRRGGNKGPESRAGPSSFHLLAVPRIQFGGIHLVCAARPGHLPRSALAKLDSVLGTASVKSYPGKEGAILEGRSIWTEFAG